MNNSNANLALELLENEGFSGGYYFPENEFNTVNNGYLDDIIGGLEHSESEREHSESEREHSESEREHSESECGHSESECGHSESECGHSESECGHSVLISYGGGMNYGSGSYKDDESEDDELDDDESEDDESPLLIKRSSAKKNKSKLDNKAGYYIKNIEF